MHVDPFHDADDLLRRVYAYVAYLVHDRAEAEDITSETFERALRYRDRYDPHKGEPVGWLLGIARRCVYDASLRPRHDHHYEAAGAAADPSETVVVRLEVAQALSELSGPDRELLALRYGADLSTREIARLLDMKRNAVDVALSRARSRLRQHLQPPPPGQPAPAPRPASNEL